MELYTILNYWKNKQNEALKNNDKESLKTATKHVELIWKLIKE